jgi:hypothetical protein
MRSIQTLKTPKKKTPMALGLVLFLLAGTIITSAAIVSADPPNTQVTTQKYCKAHISGKAQDACTIKAVDRIRTAVSDNCQGNNSDACTEKAAEAIIDKVASQNPKTVSDFNDNLSTVLQAAQAAAKNGDAGNPNPGNSPDDQINDISTGGLPKVSADSNLIQNNILPIVFGIIGAFALLNIVGSGLKYITSAGNPQKTSEARKGIVYSVAGLAIALSAEAIIAFVVNRT